MKDLENRLSYNSEIGNPANVILWFLLLSVFDSVYVYIQSILLNRIINHILYLALYSCTVIIIFLCIKYFLLWWEFNGYKLLIIQMDHNSIVTLFSFEGLGYFSFCTITNNAAFNYLKYSSEYFCYHFL